MSAVEQQITFGIALVEADATRRHGLAVQLGEGLDTATFASLGELQKELTPGVPVVVVLGPSFGVSGQLEQVEWLARTWSDLGLVLVVDELSTTVLQQALRAGVKDVLASPDRAQLIWAVERVADSLQGAVVPSLILAPPLSDTPGMVTTVFSAKGGSGTSVIATNLAVTLARRSSGTVALVDADLQFGDVAVMLKTSLEHSIADAAAAGDRLDPQLLQSLMVRHEPSGLLVLPAPTEPALAEKISADDVRRIVEVLRTFCDHIVVDTAARFDDVVLALLDLSDEVLLVSGMEVPGVKNLKLAVQTLRQLDLPVSKLKLVLVRSNTKVQMEVRDIERALALKAATVIPHDTVVPVSLNKCVPVVIDAPRSSVTKSLEALADTFVPVSDQGKRRRHSMIPGRA
ncbi:MAG: P-loop NTPase [Actinomycetota bacterium]|nr:P-loop NTPase [Actinomycetota bacterium]